MCLKMKSDIKISFIYKCTSIKGASHLEVTKNFRFTQL